METRGKCIGLNGRGFARLKKWVGWVLKEIEKFNEALLAKQVGRMINNPDSLCYRVFKARFFLAALFLRQKIHSSGLMLGRA